MADAFRPCLIIPVYNHERALPLTVAGLSRLGLHCLLVDDGSDEACRKVIDRLAADNDWIEAIHSDRNRGKGAAMKDGSRHAYAAGYSHGLQIDADNQHDSNDADAFLAAARAHPRAMIVGTAQFDESVPRARRLGRKFTQLWVHINTLSSEIEDSMCGFRVYPLRETLQVLDRFRVGNRMDFDADILVKLHWFGVHFHCLPTRVRYPAGGVSHFRMFRDNLRISWMHAGCFFGMLPRAPRILWRRFRRSHRS